MPRQVTQGVILVQLTAAHQRIDYELYLQHYWYTRICLIGHTVVAMVPNFRSHKNNEIISPFLTFFRDLLHCLAPPTWESAGGRLWCDGIAARSNHWKIINQTCWAKTLQSNRCWIDSPSWSERRQAADQESSLSKPICCPTVVAQSKPDNVNFLHKIKMTASSLQWSFMLNTW